MLGLANSVSGSSYVSMDLKDATTDLELWLKNDTGVTAAKWDDSSGNANHATQSTEGDQAAVSGGGLDFERDNSDHYDLASSIAIADQGGFCLAIVVTLETSDNDNSIFSDSGNELIKFAATNKFKLNMNNPGVESATLQYASNSFPAATKFLLLFNRSAGATARYTLFKNGTELTLDTDNSTGTENSNGFDIDTLGSKGGSSDFFDGIMHEVAFWSKGLNAQEIADVNSYLQSVHGL
tara:strand:+ start:369 stop:1082 length:714 start_codon:yes stop_codon:yes gene_type:complete